MFVVWYPKTTTSFGGFGPGNRMCGARPPKQQNNVGVLDLEIGCLVCGPQNIAKSVGCFGPGNRMFGAWYPKTAKSFGGFGPDNRMFGVWSPKIAK